MNSVVWGHPGERDSFPENRPGLGGREGALGAAPLWAIRPLPRGLGSRWGRSGGTGLDVGREGTAVVGGLAPAAAARARRVPAGCPLGALGLGAGPWGPGSLHPAGAGAHSPHLARGWGLGPSCRQSRPPARGVMATTLPTWTQRKGEERRYHDSREDGRRLPAWALTRWAGGRSHGGGAQSWGLGAADGLGLGEGRTLGELGCGCAGVASPALQVLPALQVGPAPGAEGMRARPTSPFSHYFSKGK